LENKITIALVDDHMLVRNGIKSLLEEERDLHVIAEGSNGYEAIEIVEKHKPDILIIDVRMPELNGIDAVQKIQEKGNKSRSIVLSMHDSEEYILQSIKAGAFGYLLKDTDKKEFIKAIHTVHSGEKYFSGDISNIIVSNLLQNDNTSKVSTSSNQNDDPFSLTKKEKQILKLILTGKTNSEISDALQNSKRTIETHRFNLMKKMNVKNLIELSTKASQFGLN
jgi:DNA-binding NarL/FixJ family response regulator